jgi:hypothetical protein
MHALRRYAKEKATAVAVYRPINLTDEEPAAMPVLDCFVGIGWMHSVAVSAIQVRISFSSRR